MHVPKFHGKINDENKFELFKKDEKIYNIWMDGFKPGTQVSMVIKYDRVKRTRSIEANNYYWGVVMKYVTLGLGYEMHEKELVHEGLKMKFLSEERIIGLKMCPSTSNMASEDFWEYINIVVRYMATTFNIRIPEPNEIDDEENIVSLYDREKALGRRK